MNWNGLDARTPKNGFRGFGFTGNKSGLIDVTHYINERHDQIIKKTPYLNIGDNYSGNLDVIYENPDHPTTGGKDLAVRHVDSTLLTSSRLMDTSMSAEIHG